MRVADLKECNKEQRIFRAKVAEKVFVNDCICRIRLVDEDGDMIYCLLQGLHWSDKIRDIKETQKIILAPSRIIEVPLRHSQFYRPDVKGSVVSQLIFHYNVHDFDLGIREDSSTDKVVEEFKTLKEIELELENSSIVKESIVGVIVDFYKKPNRSEMAQENFYRIKIIDDSVELPGSVGLSVYLRKSYFFRKVSIGDIVVVRGARFHRFQNSVDGTYNISSGSMAVLSWVDGRIEFCTDNFVLLDKIVASVCALQNWIFNTLQHHQFLKTNFISKDYQNQNLLDRVFYLIQILHDFPEPLQSTLIFGDPQKLAYLVHPTPQVTHIDPSNWIKLSQIKIFDQKIELTNNSSMVIVPDWAPIIRSLPTPTKFTTKAVIQEFSHKIGRDLSVTVNHKHTQQPCLEPYVLLDPNENLPFARIKALVVDFHPRIVGFGVSKENSAFGYSGLVKLLLGSDLITVYIYGKSSKLFYGLCDGDTYSVVVNKVSRVQTNLLKCFGCVEFGIRRIVQDGAVWLVLSETEIKSYD